MHDLTIIKLVLLISWMISGTKVRWTCLASLSEIVDDHGRTTRRRNISSNEFTEATTGPMGSINLETMDMPLREWIAQDRTRREIKHRSWSLYLSRLPSQTYITRPGFGLSWNLMNTISKLFNLCVQTTSWVSSPNKLGVAFKPKASFEVSYQSLSSHVPILAIWVAVAPRDIIELVIFSSCLVD